MDRECVWRPQPGPQQHLLSCPVFEVFFGGARGGGKTDGMLGEWAAHAGRYGEHAAGLMVRRSRTELYDTIERSRQLYTRLGWTFHEQDKIWRATNGARLRFAYLENDADAEGYQGHAYTRVYVEEIGNFPRPEPILKLMATLRSAAGVPVGFRATGNPGGPGHQWVKARYVDPAPLGYAIVTDELSGLKRVYIPARVSDNARLVVNDPTYIARLRASGSAELVRAWLEGDWSVVMGAFFPEFSLARHVVEPFEIPTHWVRFRSLDWGSAKPFSVGWWAVSDGELSAYPRGAIIRYREWYGMQPGRPNVGLKLTAEQVGDGIKAREADGEKIDMSVLDPAAFAQDGGPSIAERMGKRGVHCHPADNTRVGTRGRLGGWDLLRARLVGEDERPMLYVFSTCVDTIRTLPAAQHDEKRPEDLDTDCEDHCFAAGTLVNGKPIESLPRSGMVATRFGFSSYYGARQTGVRPVVKLSFSDGTSVVCTPDHRFLTEEGWKTASELKGLTLSRFDSRPTVRSFLASATTVAGRIFSGKESACTALFGNTTLAQSLTDSTSITPTTIAPTTRRATWCSSWQPIISGITRGTVPTSSGLAFSLPASLPLRHGIGARKGWNGTGGTPSTSQPGKRLSAWPRLATSAGGITRRFKAALQSLGSVIRTAGQLRCVAVEPRRAEPVYCLTVPQTGEFLLDNGLAVSNCLDDVRYACAARPWVREAEKPKPVRFEGSTQLTFNEIVARRRRSRLGED